MKDYEIHKLIEQQNPEAKERLWQRIKSELDLPDNPPAPAPVAAKPKVWKRWTAIAAALVCVITLSIVLPLTLGGEKVRFCDSEHYTVAGLEQTLKEYSSAHNGNIMYVDWYGSAEEVTTEYAYMKTNVNDIVYFREYIVNGETGEELTVSVTDNRTRVDIFNQYYDENNEERTEIKNTSVLWKTFSLYSTAIFEYDKHIYYLELAVGNAQERLTEIIESMLP